MRLLAAFIYATFLCHSGLFYRTTDHFHTKFLSRSQLQLLAETCQTSSSVKITQLWRQIVECLDRKHAAARSTFYQSLYFCNFVNRRRERTFE